MDSPGSALEVLREFFRLGLLAFGGPSAHIAFFRQRFVEEQAWLSDEEFAQLLALSQSLPGPGSSQLGFAIGWQRAGLLGALCAFIGFTLPAAVLMAGFGWFIATNTQTDWGVAPGWLQGLQVAVVAIIAKAVWEMGRSLCPSRNHQIIALSAACFLLVFEWSFLQVAVITAGFFLGMLSLRESARVAKASKPPGKLARQISAPVAGLCLLLFFGLLFLARGVEPAYEAAGDERPMALMAGMYESGALVFGGGHVVLPLLAEQFVSLRAINDLEFLAGYGAVQGVPGPVFSFAAFLGSLYMPSEWGLGGLLAIIAIFLPGMLLMMGALPFWAAWMRHGWARAGVAGINASVVGLLGAALYDPVWTAAIAGPRDIAFLLAVAMMFFSMRYQNNA